MSCRPATMEFDPCYIRQPRASKPLKSGPVGGYQGGCGRWEGPQGVPRDCGGSSSALWCYVMVIILQLKCHAAIFCWMYQCEFCQERSRDHESTTRDDPPVDTLENTRAQCAFIPPSSGSRTRGQLLLSFYRSGQVSPCVLSQTDHGFAELCRAYQYVSSPKTTAST